MQPLRATLVTQAAAPDHRLAWLAASSVSECEAVRKPALASHSFSCMLASCWGHACMTHELLLLLRICACAGELEHEWAGIVYRAAFPACPLRGRFL